MTMNIWRKREAFFSAFIFLIIFSVSVNAQPQLPSIFYGNVSINGRDAPAGSVLTAMVDGLVKGNTALVTEGYYEQINVNNCNYGETVEFWLQTPGMSNSLVSDITGTCIPGEVARLDLAFTGEEIPKSSSPGSSGPGSSGSPSGTPETGEPEEEGSPSEPQIQGNVYDMDDDFQDSESSEVSLSKGDSVTFTFGGETQTVTAKSLSEFGVLLTINGIEEIVNIGETENFDMNQDGTDDIGISLTKVEDNKAFLVFTKLKEPEFRGDTTGMLIGNLASPVLIAIIVIVIAGLGGGFYIYRRR